MKNFLVAGSLIFSLGVNAQVLDKTYAGTKVPDAVKQLLEKAQAAGVKGYDISEYNPYGVTAHKAKGNMAFSYTEITPQVLAADMADQTTVSNWNVGADADGQTVRYEQKIGGTGNVLATYDELDHPDLFERGSQGQKWANNCAILDDGSLQCLPAARRVEGANYILVNPDLAREKLALYNGHVDIVSGVVRSVEISGKISKAIAKGKLIIVNPISLLKAWGFQLDPHLEISFGNTEAGIPVIDEVNGVIKKAP